MTKREKQQPNVRRSERARQNGRVESLMQEGSEQESENMANTRLSDDQEGEAVTQGEKKKA